jgi:hypothetical protein
MIIPVMDTFIQLKKHLRLWIKFKIFKAEVENQHDLKIKIVRSDREGNTTVDIPHMAKFQDLLRSS